MRHRREPLRSDGRTLLGTRHVNIWERLRWGARALPRQPPGAVSLLCRAGKVGGPAYFTQPASCFHEDPFSAGSSRSGSVRGEERRPTGMKRPKGAGRPARLPPVALPAPLRAHTRSPFPRGRRRCQRHAGETGSTR